MSTAADEPLATYDVVIIGGGPAGSTTGSLLRKYNPELTVLILEQAKFPREHVGESQLPPVSAILDEMGCWEKIEATGFLAKAGATYHWGDGEDLSDFKFLSTDASVRASTEQHAYTGLRRLTAFQVERHVYDKILLDHAASLGCEVREECRVVGADIDGDRVVAVRLENGQRVHGRYVVDASGQVSFLRQQLGIGAKAPRKLRNVAAWDYWHSDRWSDLAESGATRVQVFKTDHGWIWFIPIRETRASVGFVCPLERVTKSHKSIESMYRDALRQEPHVERLLMDAQPEGTIRSTDSWSFVADRLVGENWFLVGASAGFADPILANGMTLTHVGARHAAYAILELERREHPPRWIKQTYEQAQIKRITNNMRFAEFWYGATGSFDDLKAHAAQIANYEGMMLTPDDAFRWLSFGGFAHEDAFLPGLGSMDLLAIKNIGKLCSNSDADVSWEINKYNVFKLNFRGADRDLVPVLNRGRITLVEAYCRDWQVLPRIGLFAVVMDALEAGSDVKTISAFIERAAVSGEAEYGIQFSPAEAYATLECMLLEGWIKAKFKKREPRMVFAHTGVGDTCGDLLGDMDVTVTG